MFEFLSDEVFQIVVITALFVIGLMLFMLYKRPSENVSQYLDDIDYRIDKINKKLDDLTNTFVNGLMVDEDETDASSANEEATEVHEEATEVHEEATEVHEEAQNVSEVRSLNYDGIEFSDIPNFSTDTSVINDNEEVLDYPEVREAQEEPREEPREELQEEPQELHEVDGKKKVNIIKRIIQSEE